MKKKVVICGSRHLPKDIQKWKKIFEHNDYEVIGYPKLIQYTSDMELLEKYKKRHEEHYKDIKNADMLLVLNLEREGKRNYIGGGVFAEIAFAIGLSLVYDKKIEIYTINPLPTELPYSEELLMWARQGWIKQFQEFPLK